MKADAAFTYTFGSVFIWNEYTTSSAVIGVPSLKVTPGRRLYVHTDASVLGLKLVASIGLRMLVWGSLKLRYSPVCWIIVRPPSSAMLSGLMSPAGTTPAIRSVAPAAGLPVEVALDAAVVSLELAPPQAVTIAPRSGIEMPMIDPRRRNSRRLMWPATYSSMTWFSSSLRLWRNSSSLCGFGSIISCFSSWGRGGPVEVAIVSPTSAHPRISFTLSNPCQGSNLAR